MNTDDTDLKKPKSYRGSTRIAADQKVKNLTTDNTDHTNWKKVLEKAQEDRNQ